MFWEGFVVVDAPVVVLVPSQTLVCDLPTAYAMCMSWEKTENVPCRRKRETRLQVHNSGLVGFGTEFDVCGRWTSLQVQSGEVRGLCRSGVDFSELGRRGAVLL